jgi:hypothetical protein
MNYLNNCEIVQDEIESILFGYAIKIYKESYPCNGFRGLQGCEMSRIPPVLESQLTDGS